MKPVMFIIIAVLLYLLGNIYVFHHLWVAMPPSTFGRVALITFAGVAVLSFFIFFVAGESMPVGLATVIYRIGTSWLFILIFFFIILFAKDLIGFANRFLHFMPADAITRYTKDNWLGLAFMIGFIVMLMTCGYLKYRWKVRVDLPITTQKSLGDRSSLRVVAISDLHLGYGISDKELDGWVEMINKENPDLILIAGDIVDNSTKPLYAGHYTESLRKLKAPMGVYACMGNHEYISGAKECTEFITNAGIELLRDASVEIDSTLYIVGRDDRSNPSRKALVDLTSNLDKTKPIILLDHQPYHLEEAESAGVDLQISGHTHQGQVWPISMITKSMYEIDHGYKVKGNTNIFVSSGIGIWGGKFRIGTQSEYVVIDIKKQ